MTASFINIIRWHRPRFIVLAVLFMSGQCLAGNLDSPAAPADSGSAMHTLQDLYSQAASGTVSPKRTGAFVEPVSGPGSSMRTVDEIQGVLPVPDNTDGAAPADVETGKKYWGLRTDGSWGPQTGTQASTSSRRSCSTYLIPYMPYSPNASQIMYVSRVPESWVGGGAVTPSPSSDITVTAVDDAGVVWNLGVTGSLDMTPKVLELTSLINDELTELGFTDGKLAIKINVPNPESAIVYASYNVGDTERSFVPVVCMP
jgi:hypothetical protein